MGGMAWGPLKLSMTSFSWHILVLIFLIIFPLFFLHQVSHFLLLTPCVFHVPATSPFPSCFLFPLYFPHLSIRLAQLEGKPGFLHNGCVKNPTCRTKSHKSKSQLHYFIKYVTLGNLHNLSVLVSTSIKWV